MYTYIAWAALIYYFPMALIFIIFFALRKGDELPITVGLTGSSGPARVWGHVKSEYSAREIYFTEGPRV